MNTNQIGRELTRRLIDSQGCDMQTAIRFFYNSELYSRLSSTDDTDIDKLYSDFEQEFYKAYNNSCWQPHSVPIPL